MDNSLRRLRARCHQLRCAIAPYRAALRAIAKGRRKRALTDFFEEDATALAFAVVHARDAIQQLFDLLEDDPPTAMTAQCARSLQTLAEAGSAFHELTAAFWPGSHSSDAPSWTWNPRNPLARRVGIYGPAWTEQSYTGVIRMLVAHTDSLCRASLFKNLRPLAECLHPGSVSSSTRRQGRSKAAGRTRRRSS